MMEKIPMVDLHSQYLRMKDEIDEAIAGVIESSAFIKGATVTAFEEHLARYLGVRHVITCGNGTDALQLSLMALDLKPGDEVITTPFTFVSTLEVVALLRLKPVLADVDPRTFNIDPEEIRRKITNRTRVIVPVHLFGQCADLEPILQIADEHHLAVIEDACQSLGTDYTFHNGTKAKAGTIGTIGCTSFFPTKNLGCYGDGGALFTNDDALAKTLRSLANHGMEQRYHYDRIGINSRLDTLQAAILDVKLKHLDEHLQARQTAAARYDEALKNCEGLQIPYRAPYSTHTFHQYTLLIDSRKREALRETLQQQGIPSMIYYPVPLHLQKAYQPLNAQKGDFPNAEKISEQVLSLPMHTELTPEIQDRITNAIKNRNK